jgi:hypothetical protein
MLFTVALRAKDFVVKAVKNMSEEERRQLAQTLVAKKLGWVLAHELQHFRGLNIQVATGIIAEDPALAGAVLHNLDSFTVSDEELRHLFQVVVDAGAAWALEPVLARFPLDPQVAKHLVANGYERLVGEHLALFKRYGEQQFHQDRFAWQASFDLRRAPGHRYKA